MVSRSLQYKANIERSGVPKTKRFLLASQQELASNQIFDKIIQYKQKSKTGKEEEAGERIIIIPFLASSITNLKKTVKIYIMLLQLNKPI